MWWWEARVRVHGRAAASPTGNCCLHYGHHNTPNCLPPPWVAHQASAPPRVSHPHQSHVRCTKSVALLLPPNDGSGQAMATPASDWLASGWPLAVALSATRLVTVYCGQQGIAAGCEGPPYCGGAIWQARCTPLRTATTGVQLLSATTRASAPGQVGTGSLRVGDQVPPPSAATVRSRSAACPEAKRCRWRETR